MIVVLVHGFPGFSVLPLVGEYFHGVPGRLARVFRDLQVIAPQLKPFGQVKERASQLAGVMPAGEKVHIIAHSGGGIDARFLASPGGLNLSARVASITTIGSPHHGSQIADLLAAPTGEFASLGGELEAFAKSVGGFTTSGMAQFNRDITDAEGVPYSSYAGTTSLLTRGVIGTPFAVSFPLILKREGPNDGWVSVASAQWGTFRGTVPADHAEEIGHELSAHGALLARLGHPVFDHLKFYEDIVEGLGAQRI